MALADPDKEEIGPWTSWGLACDISSPSISGTDAVTFNTSYRPLEPREIRLLILEPGDLKKKMSYRLKHVNIDESPRYEALSYTWGTEIRPTNDQVHTVLTESAKTSFGPC